MKECLVSLLLLLLVSHSALGIHVLSEEYRFSADLDPSYRLHWNFDIEAGTIAFAVNVSTEGWVGFGLSPNGGMAGSDVIIGWVETNGQVEFKDRYAIDRILPPVDQSQDWCLVSGAQENGRTILEFTRNLTSCDDNDLNIEADTARVIWAYHSSDPVSETNIPQHQARGSASLNLLGGLAVERVEPDSVEFNILVHNVTIPAVDTTYWCEVGMLPTEVQEQERYIYKISPVISEVSSPHVHHMIIYLCTELNHTFVGASDVCDDTHLDIRLCRGRVIIASWAVGGVDFVFPSDVALPLGGPGAWNIVVIEMHYDNPTLQTGVVDNSGISFSYISTQPLHLAGLLSLGALANSALIVPPGTPDFTIAAFCPKECTQAYFPPEGITIFGNMLHTHVIGHGLVVDHLRETESGLTEELEPIDENRRYDFNYQQFNNLPRTRQVLPGDEIRLQCFYGTSNKDEVVLGGESTRDEMCFSFLYYYPRTNLSICFSLPQSYYNFAIQYINSSMINGFIQNLRSEDDTIVRSILNEVEWTQDAIDSLQDIYLNGPQFSSCIGMSGSIRTVNEVPKANISYTPPDVCIGKPTIQTCKNCCGTGDPSSYAAKLGQLSVITMLIVSYFATFLF